MTQEEKQLLLKDLCARFPYKCRYMASTRTTIWYKLIPNTLNINRILDGYYDEIKPYLRPMESLTDEEEEEYEEVIRGSFEKQLEFYLRNHLDFRGLIPKGLAIEAPEGMYNK